MSLFKFGTIGMFQNVKNNPRAIAKNDIYNGYVFKIVDNDATYGEAATPLVDATDAKAAQLWVQMNIIDTPELDNQADFKISSGSPVNAFCLNDLKGYTVEISSDLITTVYADVAQYDHLIPIPLGTGQMKWKKADDTGYACTLKVLEKTTFGGTGFYCKISSN